MDPVFIQTWKKTCNLKDVFWGLHDIWGRDKITTIKTSNSPINALYYGTVRSVVYIYRYFNYLTIRLWWNGNCSMRIVQWNMKRLIIALLDIWTLLIMVLFYSCWVGEFQLVSPWILVDYYHSNSESNGKMCYLHKWKNMRDGETQSERQRKREKEEIWRKKNNIRWQK